MGAPLDLDLDITPSLIGRKVRPVQAEVTRELTEADIALLATERGIQPTLIQRLSERHHALARCLASGLSTADACAITGYTPSRVSVLKGSPAFEELVAFYQSAKAEAVADLSARMTSVAIDAVGILQERLEDTPEAVPNGELLDIAKFAADRTGHGPASRQTHLHLHANLADRLKAARGRTAALPVTAEGPGKIIEGVALAPTNSEDEG